MTMVIDRSTPTYKTRYLELKKLFNVFDEDDKALIATKFKDYEIELFGTIGGIDQQIEKFQSNAGMVFYITLEKNLDKPPVIILDRTVLVAKEIEDD